MLFNAESNHIIFYLSTIYIVYCAFGHLFSSLQCNVTFSNSIKKAIVSENIDNGLTSIIIFRNGLTLTVGLVMLAKHENRPLYGFLKINRKLQLLNVNKTCDQKRNKATNHTSIYGYI